ncbi:MAG: hypothetical protein VYE47_13070 [Pseudomonadota bacterium]|nr:hypothetical protein [Pseudomonadota bacterium]
MCLDTIKIQRKRGKAIKTGESRAENETRTGKQYRYKVRGTRTSQLVNKAVSHPVYAN